jgi:hypothetical protein
VRQALPVDRLALPLAGLTDRTLADKVAADGQPNLSNCADVTTPQCLQALYNFASYRQRAVRNNSYGIGQLTLCWLFFD